MKLHFSWTRSVLTCLMSFLLASQAMAATPYQEGSEESFIRQRLSQLLPAMPPILSVKESAIDGLYEVILQSYEVVYTDKKAQLLLQGRLLDIKSQRNLTEESVKNLSRIAFNEFPLQDAIKITRGKGTREVVVFSDPFCQYCQRLERSFSKMRDLTVYIFVYPILGEKSVEKAQAIWCSARPAEAWDLWMRRNITPKKQAGCDASALERNLALGKQKNILGTPTLIFKDGTRISGAMERPDMEHYLSRSTAP